VSVFEVAPKPALDLHGLSHIGKVRSLNQDHFVLATLNKRLDVLLTNLPDEAVPDGDSYRLSTVAAVADGVGSGVGGEQASRVAVEYVLRYLAHARRCFEVHDESADTFANDLQRAALAAHAELTGRRIEDPSLTGLATTLTMVVGVWPWIYLLQVGDSRYYLYRGGRLTQITRDQTLAQDLVDEGVLSLAEAPQSMTANILSSAIGGPTAVPVVSRVRSDWRDIHLLCSDGLTKHVSDERITARLAAMTSARQACEALLQDALDGGGSDNITVIVGRAAPPVGRA
jgi:serine/threonine protein phosphatase PrpC